MSLTCAYLQFHRLAYALHVVQWDLLSCFKSFGVIAVEAGLLQINQVQGA